MSLGTPRAIVISFTTVLGALALWPTDRIQYLPVRSLWVAVFHVEPYSTGITRAMNHLLHGDLHGAWEFNRLIVVVFPLAVALIIVNAVRWHRSLNA